MSWLICIQIYFGFFSRFEFFHKYFLLPSPMQCDNAFFENNNSCNWAYILAASPKNKIKSILPISRNFEPFCAPCIACIHIYIKVCSTFIKESVLLGSQKAFLVFGLCRNIVDLNLAILAPIVGPLQYTTATVERG